MPRVTDEYGREIIKCAKCDCFPVFIPIAYTNAQKNNVCKYKCPKCGAFSDVGNGGQEAALLKWNYTQLFHFYNGAEKIFQDKLVSELEKQRQYISSLEEKTKILNSSTFNETLNELRNNAKEGLANQIVELRTKIQDKEKYCKNLEEKIMRQRQGINELDEKHKEKIEIIHQERREYENILSSLRDDIAELKEQLCEEKLEKTASREQHLALIAEIYEERLKIQRIKQLISGEIKFPFSFADTQNPTQGTGHRVEGTGGGAARGTVAQAAASQPSGTSEASGSPVGGEAGFTAQAQCAGTYRNTEAHKIHTVGEIVLFVYSAQKEKYTNKIIPIPEEHLEIPKQLCTHTRRRLFRAGEQYCPDCESVI